MTSLLIRLGAIGFFAVQIGCSGTPHRQKRHLQQRTQEQTTGTKDKLDLNALADAVNKAELVPSPIEMEAKLKSAGLQQNLGAFIPASKILRSSLMTMIKWLFVPVSSWQTWF